MARTNQVLTFTHDDEKGTLTWAAGGKATTLYLDKVSAPVMSRAAIHGLKQRCGDKAALANGSTPEEKLAAVTALVDHYNSGTSEWSPDRAAGSPRSVLAKLSVEEIEAYLAELKGQTPGA